MAIKKRLVSPRQKMINLMYIVLLAMLALYRGVGWLFNRRRQSKPHNRQRYSREHFIVSGL